MPLYPFLFDPIYKEKVWGGRALERFGRALPGSPDAKIGESWELADLAGTSPSGGGGGAAHSRIRNGPLAGRTIRDAMADLGSAVMGSARPPIDGAFPLLLKYLDAAEDLSVQVHPSPAYAAAHPEAHLKSEAWYVVHAEPGAVIYRGLRAGVTKEGFLEAVQAGEIESVLEAVPVGAGDCHYLPSGTCHALGAGVFVAEVQTASDTTFRVFDWGRTDRELHLDQAMECIDFTHRPASREAVSGEAEEVSPGTKRRPLVRTPYFEMTEWSLAAASRQIFAQPGATALMVVAGAGVLEWGREERRRVATPTGTTVLVPGVLQEAHLIADEPITVLEIGLPQRTEGE